MRIVHVRDEFPPRLGYQEAYLACEQAKMGHEVYVVAADRYTTSTYSANKSLLGESRIIGAGFSIEEGIKVWRLKTRFEWPPNILWIGGLEKKVLELEPDIVIMHGIISLSAIRIARLKKRRCNFKLIFDDHMAYDCMFSKLGIVAYPVFKRFFSPLILETADGLVAVAQTTIDFMHRMYGIPLERITYIPLGSDDTLFRFDDTARGEIREQLSIGGSDVAFIYTGKMIPIKKLNILIEAMKILESHQELKILLVGGGIESYVDGLKQDIKAQGLEDRFIWHDAVPNKELYKYYSAADVAIWPREASLSAMDASSCSLPVILSDDCEITERVERGNGLTFRGGDARDLARQMEKLLDPELRREMGQNGRKFIEEELSWRIIAKQFIELVER